MVLLLILLLIGCTVLDKSCLLPGISDEGEIIIGSSNLTEELSGTQGKKAQLQEGVKLAESRNARGRTDSLKGWKISPGGERKNSLSIELWPLRIASAQGPPLGSTARAGMRCPVQKLSGWCWSKSV